MLILLLKIVNYLIKIKIADITPFEKYPYESQKVASPTLLSIFEAAKCDDVIGSFTRYDVKTDTFISESIKDIVIPKMEDPLDDGAFKVVYTGAKMRQFFQEVLCVLKVSRSIKEENFNFYMREMKIASFAKVIADDLNLLLGEKKIKVLEGVILNFHNDEMSRYSILNDIGRFWYMEEQLEGEFIKFNDKIGGICSLIN